jgi:hypothetical protein
VESITSFVGGYTRVVVHYTNGKAYKPSLPCPTSHTVLLDLTERKNLQRLISLIPARLVLPHVKDYLLQSTSSVTDLESEGNTVFRTLTDRLLRLISVPEPLRQTDLYFFLSSPSILPFLLFPSILIAWSQSFPPETFSDHRRIVLEFIDQIGPQEAMSTLSSISTIMQVKKKPPKVRAKVVPVEEEEIVYPDYAKRTVRALMGRQLVRDGGVRGLFSNVFGVGDDGECLGSASIRGSVVLSFAVRSVGTCSARIAQVGLRDQVTGHPGSRHVSQGEPRSLNEDVRIVAQDLTVFATRICLFRNSMIMSTINFE